MVQNDNDKSAITNGGGEGSKFGVVTTSVASSEPYNPRKPKWWKALAGRATKSQKRAIRSVLDDRGLRLPEVPFGSTLDWNNVFPPASVVVDATHETDDEACKEQNHEQQRDIWLELGFGRGENLLALAHLYRDRILLGRGGNSQPWNWSSVPTYSTRLGFSKEPQSGQQ
jgi:hypothetical protein